MKRWASVAQIGLAVTISDTVFDLSRFVKHWAVHWQRNVLAVLLAVITTHSLRWDVFSVTITRENCLNKC